MPGSVRDPRSGDCRNRTSCKSPSRPKFRHQSDSVAKARPRRKAPRARARRSWCSPSQVDAARQREGQHDKGVQQSSVFHRLKSSVASTVTVASSSAATLTGTCSLRSRVRICVTVVLSACRREHQPCAESRCQFTLMSFPCSLRQHRL